MERAPFILLGRFIATLVLVAGPAAASGEIWHVAAGGSGNGRGDAPFGTIQEALAAARAGDVVIVGPGTYDESIRTTRGASRRRPITLKAAEGRGSVLVTAPGRVLTVRHPHIIVEGLVLDGQYGQDDLVLVDSPASGFVLRDTEVRRTSRDAVDIRSPKQVLIENSLIHRALNPAGGRTDAHGIVAGAVRGLTVRNTEVHTFSGDAFQIDPERSPAGWTDVVIEGCRFWLAPLAAAENGFPAGTVPGENAVDTKASAAAPRAKLAIRDTEAWGFRRGSIANMAAFNIKENVAAVIDGVTVFDSEIAFRLRGLRTNGGADVRVQNAVIHSTAVAFRFEDDIRSPRAYNVTIGRDVGRILAFNASPRTVADVRNLLVLGDRLPPHAQQRSNLAAGTETFVDAARHDYRLCEGSPAIDGGFAIAWVTHDRNGTKRPIGSAYDVGAYEHSSGESAAPSCSEGKRHVATVRRPMSAEPRNYQSRPSAGAQDFRRFLAVSAWRQNCYGRRSDQPVGV